MAAAGRIVVQAQPKPRDHSDRGAKIHVRTGRKSRSELNEPVVFQLTTQDVAMGFSVPDFAVSGLPSFQVRRSRSP